MMPEPKRMKLVLQWNLLFHLVLSLDTARQAGPAPASLVLRYTLPTTYPLPLLHPPPLRNLPQPLQMLRRHHRIAQATHHAYRHVARDVLDARCRVPALVHGPGEVAEVGPVVDDGGEGEEGVFDDEAGDLGRGLV